MFISQKLRQARAVLLVNQVQKQRPTLSANTILKPDRTFYIGDRTLDIEFALNSGIKSLNFLSCNKEGNQQIRALEDIITLLSNQ